MVRPSIYDDLSLLYELALAIGTSLDLQENCDAFLRTLVSRKDLDFAAVWLQDGRLDAPRGVGGFSLVYASPEAFAPPAHLPAGHPVVRPRAEPLVVRAEDAAFEEYVVEREVASGTIALFPLGDRGRLGTLKLYARGERPGVFAPRVLAQLTTVVTKFATSLEGALAHGRLRAEIRERRAAEEELRRRDRAMAATTSGMVIVDLHQRDQPIIYANPAFTHMTGYAPDEVTGRNCRFLQGPDTDPTAVQQIREALRDLRECTVVLKNYRKDGTPFWNELIISPVVDDAGRPTHYVGIQNDITDRVEADRALREAKQVAEESVRAKERFLATMSHEMRTPLNAVNGLTHLLHDHVPTDGPARRYLDAIRFSSDNLLALINDVLDFAKLEAGKLLFEEVPFRTDTLLANLAEALDVRAAEKGLTLDVHIVDGVPPVLVGDPTRLNQILFNLVGNALKFTEEGRVTVRVQAAEAVGDRATIAFAIEDTGIGIPEEQQARIFDSFTQAASDTTRRYGGTGLGLTIVRELTERQGGQVDLESVPGQGSTFTVTLPFGVGEAVADAEASPEADLRGVRVLVAEDNEINQLITERLLERWGADVEVAANGRQALERLRARPFDAVLMDVQMPEMDGFEAARRIRGELGFPSEELPIVALTASVLSEHRGDVHAAGMDAFLLKPFEPTDLLRTLSGLLGRADGPAPTAPSSGRAASGAAEAPIIDLSVLEANVGGDRPFVRRMTGRFVDAMVEQEGALAQAAEAEAWDAVRAIAHKMKSAAGMFGAAQLADALRELERRASAQAPDPDLPLLAAEACLLSARVRAAVQAEAERRACA